MTEKNRPLHPLLLQELKRAESRTMEEWRSPALVQALVDAVEKHRDRQALLVQLHAVAHQMFNQGSMVTATYYLTAFAVVMGDLGNSAKAIGGALDAAAATLAGKHVNREAAGVRAALPDKAGASVGVRRGKKP